MTSIETADVAQTLIDLIADRIEHDERSLQKEIGASEIGTPCVRKLALKLSGTDPVPVQVLGEDHWRATVGTAVHAWLAAMLRDDNARLAVAAINWKGKPGERCHEWCDEAVRVEKRPLGKPRHKDRWIVEHRTPIGTIDSITVPGTLDVYDRLTHTLVDWKVPGPTAIKKYRHDKSPGPEYETQVQLYGRGLSRVAGEDVRWVGIMFLPANGELKDHFYWETEFDPEVGKEALRRAREVSRLVAEEGRAIIGKLKTFNDHCSHCPFFSPGTHDLEHECPGDPSLMANADDALADILPNG